LYFHRGRAGETAVFLVPAEDSVAVTLSSEHSPRGKPLFSLVPLLGEFEYPPQDLQLDDWNG
jgi:hypothetical protein